MISKALNREKVRLLWGMILIICLLSSLLLSFVAAGESYAAGPYSVTVTRTLPTMVLPGQTFNVTVTFAAPANDFNAIGLGDFAPPGWSVSANNTWNTPNSNTNLVTANRVDYIWDGPYTSGTNFTAIFHVTVPAAATPGTYYFNNLAPSPRIEYYVAYDGSFTDNIVGQNSVIIPSNAAEIQTYSLQGSPGFINSGAGTITVTLPSGTNLTNLVATFTTSSGVTSVKVGATGQISGTTANNFTIPVTYTVTAQDGTTTKNWVVTVTLAEPVPAYSNISIGFMMFGLAALIMLVLFRRLQRSKR
jgi:hypothetical protein